MRRRAFLIAGGVGLLAAAGALTGGAVVARIGKAETPPPLPPRALDGLRQRPPGLTAPQPLPYHFGVPQLERRAPSSLMFELPGDGNLVALTVDDGGDSDVVGAYARWIADTGMRVTFFVTGSLASWTTHRDALAAHMATGHVQLANHTWTHGDQTAQSNQQIVDDLMTNHEFIQSTYGVDAKPYYRPPFGRYDDRTRAAAASVGYTSCVMWYGTLADAGPISEHDLLVQAQTWLLPQHLVIGHANYPPVTNLFGALTDIMRERNLQPVTLDDVFSR